MRDIQLLEFSVEDMNSTAFQHMNHLHDKVDQLRLFNENLIKNQVEEALKELNKIESEILSLQKTSGLPAISLSEEVQSEINTKVENYTNIVKKIEQFSETQAHLSELIKSIRQHAFDLEAYL